MLLNCALEGYAQHLFACCKPYYHIEDTVNGMVDLYPHLRGSFVGVWRLLRRWKQLEPGRSRTVAPVPMIAVSLLWGWVAFASSIFAMFSGLLHPAEFLGALRSDLVLPSDLGHVVGDAFLYIRSPKTRRVVRTQHSRISDADFLLGTLAWLLSLAPWLSLAWHFGAVALAPWLDSSLALWLCHCRACHLPPRVLVLRVSCRPLVLVLHVTCRPVCLSCVSLAAPCACPWRSLFGTRTLINYASSEENGGASVCV
eukprot:530098-Amphidinium_carterae.1